MKHFFPFVSIFLLLGCRSEPSQLSHPTEGYSDIPISINITPVLKDSISIRALDYNSGIYWFAGSNGTYGKMPQTEGDMTFAKINPEDAVAIDFRSIAVTESYTYLMTAGSPALIYKISHTNDHIDLVYEETGEKVFYDSIKFWNDQEGIAFGDPTENCLSVLTTNDAGTTWNKIDCTMLPEFISGEAAFAASNSNVVINGDHTWLATGGAAARVIYSRDRGITWETYDTPIIAGSQMTGIFAMDFYDHKLGVIIGGDWEHKSMNTNTKALTKDGGKTWNLITNGKPPGYCSDIIFIPETEGQELLAVGSTGIWWSGNQGLDWRQISQEGFYTVRMKDKREGYLAGRNRVNKFLLQR